MVAAIFNLYCHLHYNVGERNPQIHHINGIKAAPNPTFTSRVDQMTVI